MQPAHRIRYAYAGIRVSSKEQGLKDSPQAQQEQIDRYAAQNNIAIIDYIRFYESGSKKIQPMQRAIDQIKHDTRVELFIVKSIDRFTRGGFKPYGDLKAQLDDLSIDLIDTFGVISSQKVNTLEYLGLEYDWSVYSPTLKTELLEAERSRDEIRDIMSRMIGAQIRYCRMGYWVRGDLYGMKCEKRLTSHGKRTILVPHETEAADVKKMFKMRAEGLKTDQEIIDHFNKRGFRTHTQYVRDKSDPTRIIDKRGGEPLKLKSFLRIINNPVYAGVTCEKWTNNEAIKLKFDGIVSIDLFNKANKGKCTIVDDGSTVKFIVSKAESKKVKAASFNPDYPYKRAVTCPYCGKALHGSASRGKSGKYYPVYHCRRNGHSFRMATSAMEDYLRAFIAQYKVSDAFLDKLEKYVTEEWDKRTSYLKTEREDIERRINSLSLEARQSMEKIKYLSNQTAIKFIEEELVRIEEDIKQLQIEKAALKVKQPLEIPEILDYTRYFFAHLDYLLFQQSNPQARAAFFSLIFKQTPRFSDLDVRTPENEKTTSVETVFQFTSEYQDTLGWGGGIRTPECMDQNHVPYHLATPQCERKYCDSAK